MSTRWCCSACSRSSVSPAWPPTRAVLDALPQRRHFSARLRELLAVGLLTTPRPINGRLFHTRRLGAQRQAVLYVRDTLEAEDRALVDPNTFDAAGLVTIDWYFP